MLEKEISAILGGEPSSALPVIENFIQQHAKSITFPELDNDNLREKIWEALFKYVKQPTESVQKSCLSMIRILSRDKSELEDLVTDDRLGTLLELAYVFDDQLAALPAERRMPDSVVVESLMCLCNLVHNSANSLNCLSGKRHFDSITKRIVPFSVKDDFAPLSELRDDIKYYSMRLLFILTAKGSDFRNLVDQSCGYGFLVHYLCSVANNAKLVDPEKPEKQRILSESEVNLASEILKTIFNFLMGINTLTLDEDKCKNIILLVSTCRALFLCQIDSVEKKNQLHGNIVDLLTSLDIMYYNGLSYPINSSSFVDQNYKTEEMDTKILHYLIKFLKYKLDVTPDIYHQNENLSPILTVMCKTAACCRHYRKYLRSEILPPLKDVHTRPEVGDTIRNQLCRLLTSPVTHVRDLTAHFLFILCKENVGRMVKYTGYGNAAGLFATRGLLGQPRQSANPQYSSDSEDSDTEEYLAMKHTVNPVTGCYEPPRVDPMAGYTEEQKEYEAMKLVNLMDQLNRAGVVQPCRIGADGRPEPIEHVLQLQEDLPNQQVPKN